MEPKEILAVIDSMNLDEEFINNLLNNIMTRTSFTTRHMENALRFLKYKLAVNKEESLHCVNEREYEFVGKLIRDANSANIDLLCEITNVVLQLDPNTIIGKAEHLLQQIFSQIDIPTFQVVPEIIDEDTPKALLDLKLSSGILEAVITQKKKVALPFLQVRLENMVFSPDEKIVSFFYMSTVQNFMKGVTGYSILDRLWTSLKDAKEFKLVTLKAVCCLADYYLPVDDVQKQHSKYSIAADSAFWESVLFGLQSSENAVRKRAIHLIKRALESLTGSQKDININTEEMVMVWDKKNEKILKSMWDNFFILIDSLEEMQSNIVLPSLKLFESVKHLGHCWLSCAYNIGLQHVNATVRFNCIMYRLEIKVETIAEASALLNALNDINLYENEHDSTKLTNNITNALEDKQSFLNILEAIPNVNWSPVPLYYLCETLGKVVYPSLLLNVEHQKMCSIINDILRIPCNNPVIKKAIYAHICNLIINCCCEFTWEDYVTIYPNLHTETPITSCLMPSLASHIKKNLYLSDNDKHRLAEAISVSCENINIALLYVKAHEEDGITFFLSIIDKKVDKIIDICNSSFTNKAHCLAEVNFLINIYCNTIGRSEPYLVFINGAVKKHFHVILQSLFSLLTTTSLLDVDGIMTLFESLKNMPINKESEKFIPEIYKASVLLLKDKETPMDKRTYVVSVMMYLLNNHVMYDHHRNEMLSLEHFLAVIKNIGKDMLQGSGKLKNVFYEKTCEIVLLYLKEVPNYRDVIELLAFVEDVMDCGGYGCLKFILRIINNILPKLLDNESINFNLCLFLPKIWKQICELKTSKEYTVCIDDYVKLITQDALLKHPVHNGVLVEQYGIIIGLVASKRTPLYYLAKHLSSRNVLIYDNMVPTVCNIILYAVVPKKDQRITENLTIDLYSKLHETIAVVDMPIYSQHIHYLSISMLAKVTDVVRLNELSDRIMAEIDSMLVREPKYYNHSTIHRKVFRALQTLLFIFLKTRQVDVKKTAVWCMNMLKLPHENSVKICLNWYIALYIYSSEITIDCDLISYLSHHGVPLSSQFTITYYVLRHKIPALMQDTSETEFVLDFILSHTMGPVFSTRLKAQYYAKMLFDTGNITKTIHIDKYSNLLSILNSTLGELLAAKDKSYMAIKNDYFTQLFDIVADLTPIFIFNGMQRRCKQFNEAVDSEFLKKVLNEVGTLLTVEDYDAFYVEWKGTYRCHALLHYHELPTCSQMDMHGEGGTIQKKYVPWRSMSDMETDKFRRKLNKVSDLIVVASLVNRAPNLGGLARTCEVFGVLSYVIDNMNYVSDKQFQSLSVSADRWVDMEEVHTGHALKEYLQRKKKEGYAVVAAEQTSNSRSLVEFWFPKKTLIMLGNEKEGIPPNLLPLMDYCVEIPQQGVIRSLNVHVSASIFIWEYTRQMAKQSAR